MEGAIEKLLKDTKVYTENISSIHSLADVQTITLTCSLEMLTSAQQWSIHFANIIHPISGEFDITEKHPEAQVTVDNVDVFQAAMEDLKEALTPEVELIQGKIQAPAKELQGIMKQLRKTITKRDHKVCIPIHMSHLLLI